MKTKLTSLTLRIALLALLCATPIRLRATTYTVTSTNDSGSGSLRASLASATNGDTIDMTGVTGTIVLTNGQLNVPNSVTMLGPGASALTVSGNNASRVFNVTGTNVTISGLTIANGNTTNLNGAGIYAGGGAGSVFTLTGSVITNNSTLLDGGGIYNSSSVTISNCTISGNGAPGGSGGGIYNSNSTMTVNASTLSGNNASVGGGILNDGEYGSAMLAVNASTLSGNWANYGGGIFNDGGYGNATLTINVSTFSTNTAGGGGAIINGGAWGGSSVTLTINAGTFSGNSAGDGGIENDGRFDGSATLEIGDTILNAGTSGATIFSLAGTVTSDGYNLSSDDGGGYLTSTADQINTNPLLGPLQNNGGPTFTHALLWGSPAIDQGNRYAAPGLHLNTDQRGFQRPIDFPGIPNAFGGDGSDIGAFEAQKPLGGNPLRLTRPAESGNGSFQFSFTNTFTNTPGASFTVFSTTNLALPFSSWTMLGAPIVITSGQFQFTDAQAPNSPQRFYQVTSP